MPSQFIRGQIVDNANRPLVHDLRLNVPDITLGDSEDRVLVFRKDGTVRYLPQSVFGTSVDLSADDIGDIISGNSLLTVSQPDLSAGDITLTVNVAAIDHGLLTGLGDDDHPQYPLAGSTETISGTWTFSAATITFNNDIKVNDQILLGSPSDTAPKRLSAQYDHGSTKANWTVYKIVVSDSMTSTLALDDRAMEISYTMTGQLSGGSVAGLKYGLLITMNEDTTYTTGWTRYGVRVNMNHTNAASGDAIGFHAHQCSILATNSSSAEVFRANGLTNSVVVNKRFYTSGRSVLTFAATPQNSWAIGDDIIEEIGSSVGVVTLNGVAGGGVGRWLYLINTSGSNHTVNHLSGAAAAADQIYCWNAAAFTWTAGSTLILYHNGTNWRQIRQV